MNHMPVFRVTTKILHIFDHTVKAGSKEDAEAEYAEVDNTDEQ